jgi:hypothetical protein
MVKTTEQQDRAWRAAAPFALALIAFAWCASAIAAPSNEGPGALESIRSAIGRFEKSLSLSPSSDPNSVAGASRARNEIESGRIFAALYRLQSPFSDTAMRNYLAGKARIRALAPFEVEWKNAGKEIAEEDARLSESRLAKLPAAVRALVEVNRAQSHVYYNSALLYGRETEVRNGLAYVGLAKGNLAFAVWASTLDFPAAGRAAVRSPRSEIRDLEIRVLEAYDRPGATRPPGLFENINSTLKAAGELEREGKFDGAAQQLLDAEFYFDLFSAEGSPPSSVEALRQASADALARIESSPTDPSLGRMIWELAQGNLAPERDGKVPPERLARAAVQLERVLPRYFRLTESAASEGQATSAPAKVRITLVRWPYT